MVPGRPILGVSFVTVPSLAWGHFGVLEPSFNTCHTREPGTRRMSVMHVVLKTDSTLRLFWLKYSSLMKTV